ncbi:hypothetical protein [Kitasatospora aureofaciens]|uniref:hypothetical protein n=1 Tax=Kitasatospora aureofaciens TaxID=1894 RepID=UPI000A565CCD|nr:hypothetical protein [Kitasatospora aureofaciens]
MRRHRLLYATATRYDLIEHTRNRFAMLLVAAFIPTWVTLVYFTIPTAPVPFRLRATGQQLAPAGNQLMQITGALNAVTLITGFMMFAATFNGHRFDRRLAMAGYPRTHLVLAKTTSLTLASGLVAAYATTVICAASTPQQPLQLAAALAGAALTYGALGVIYGSVLRREVEGMFAMIMTSVIDVGLQNPMASTGADSPFIRLLPSYGATQAATAAAFSTHPTPAYLALQLVWFTAAAAVSLLTFHHRTRLRTTATLSGETPRLPSAQAPRPCTGEPAEPAEMP